MAQSGLRARLGFLNSPLRKRNNMKVSVLRPKVVETAHGMIDVFSRDVEKRIAGQDCRLSKEQARKLHDNIGVLLDNQDHEPDAAYCYWADPTVNPEVTFTDEISAILLQRFLVPVSELVAFQDDLFFVLAPEMMIDLVCEDLFGNCHD